jgi:hypothetical protein
MGRKLRTRSKVRTKDNESLHIVVEIVWLHTIILFY